MTDASACPNCGAARVGRYCSACGQDNRHERLRARELLGAAIEHLVDLDLPIARTLSGLTLRPGHVCREYVAGRRRRYTNPIKYAILTTAILTLVFAVFDISPARAFDSATPSNATASAPPRTAGDTLGQGIQARVDRLAQDASRFVEINLNVVGLATFPIMAWLLMLLFRRTGHTYAEHAVFAFFVFGQIFLLNTIFALLGGYRSPLGLIILEPVTIAYLTWAGRVFYGTGLVTTTLRMILVELASMVMSAIVGTVLVTGWIMWNLVVPG